MADQTASSIDIAAPKVAVMAVIADVEAYPQWAASISNVDVLAVADEAPRRPMQARFTLDAGPIKDTYVLTYDWVGADKVTWTLVEGNVIKSLDGSYTLEDGSGADTTTVTYHLSVDLAIPMLGMLKRKAERAIIDTALKDLKRRVENGDET